MFDLGWECHARDYKSDSHYDNSIKCFPSSNTRFTCKLRVLSKEVWFLEDQLDLAKVISSFPWLFQMTRHMAEAWAEFLLYQTSQYKIVKAKLFWNYHYGPISTTWLALSLILRLT